MVCSSTRARDGERPACFGFGALSPTLRRFCRVGIDRGGRCRADPGHSSAATIGLVQKTFKGCSRIHLLRRFGYSFSWADAATGCGFGHRMFHLFTDSLFFKASPVPRRRLRSSIGRRRASQDQCARWGASGKNTSPAYFLFCCVMVLGIGWRHLAFPLGNGGLLLRGTIIDGGLTAQQNAAGSLAWVLSVRPHLLERRSMWGCFPWDVPWRRRGARPHECDRSTSPRKSPPVHAGACCTSWRPDHWWARPGLCHVFTGGGVGARSLEGFGGHSARKAEQPCRYGGGLQLTVMMGPPARVRLAFFWSTLTIPGACHGAPPLNTRRANGLVFSSCSTAGTFDEL